MFTIGLPGCTAWRGAVDYLKLIECKRVRLAFDMDLRTNPNVAAAQRACARAIQNAGMDLLIETWPDEFKGIDDFLVSTSRKDNQ
jgi:hypothetical protein